MRQLPVATTAHTTAHHRAAAPWCLSRLTRASAPRRPSSAAIIPFVQIQADKAPSLLPWITTTATTLASTAGFAVLMAWMPLLLGASPEALPTSRIEDATPDGTIDAGTEPLKGLARRNVKCAECGLIESIREMDGHTGREITVRLQDGSSRVMIDANPGKLRLGERVKIIDGLAGSGA